MSYFFTNHFREALFANQNLMDTASIRLRLLRTAPSLSSAAASQWLTVSTTDELLTYIGWEEVTGIGGYPGDMQAVAVSVFQQGLNNYVLFTAGYEFNPGIDSAVRVEGFAIEYVGTLAGVANPLIFVTNTPIGTYTNLDPNDKLVANPDTNTNLPGATNRWLFAWADPASGATTVNPLEGPLTLLRAPPIFEASNTMHVWLYPQRANMVANPSFEFDNSQWAPLPTRIREAAFQPGLEGAVADKNALLGLTPEVGDFYTTTTDEHIWEYIGPDPNDDLVKWTDHGLPMGGGWCGHFTQPGADPMAIESNVWETRQGYDDHEVWTLQLMAKGSGKLKLALVSWDPDYRTTNVDWGTETWDLVPGAWIHVACVRYGPQAHTAMLRIEVASGLGSQDVKIDRVLAERGALKEYPYFDGDERYGLVDDFSWYGGSGRRGISYSMWYGGRRSVVGRLFAVPTDTDAPGDIVTDVDVMAAGMVYDWVPAGVTVIPHMDVFYPTDLKGPLPPRRGTVLPPAGPDDPLGVGDPWTPETLPQGLWLGSTVDIGVSGVSGSFVHGIRPTVTINKGASQADPSTTTTTVTFDVVFSEPVTGFTGADVILGGTALPTTAVVSGSGAVYTVVVSGMTVEGNVTASIVDSAALSATNDRTQSSTSTDNDVTWFDPLKRTGWWGIAYSARQTYTQQVGGSGRVKLAGALAYGSNGGGALDVTMVPGSYVVSIGESAFGTPNSIVLAQETWGFGGAGGPQDGAYTGYYGGGRTELRTAASRASAVLVAPGGGAGTNAGGGGIGGFPDGTPPTAGHSVGGSDYGGKPGSGGKLASAGLAGGGYAGSGSGLGNWGFDGDTGSGVGAGGQGGAGNYSFGPGGAGGGGGGGWHGGGGGSGGNGSSTNGGGGGGGSGYTGTAVTTIGTYNGVAQGLGLAAMQVRQSYSARAMSFLLGSNPQTYVTCEEGADLGCIVLADLISTKPFFDRDAATIFDGVAAGPTQMFQGIPGMGGRGSIHVSRIASQRNPDFQMPAADAASGFFWNPPAFGGSADWAIEWTQQTISGNADGPGCSSVTTPGSYGVATANQLPWKVAATATTIGITVATTGLSTLATAQVTLASKPTTQYTRYGISYNHLTDTFSFYRSDGATGTQTRTAAGIPTTGQWNLQTWRPLMFSSLTANAESYMQDVALFSTARTQAQFIADFNGLSGTTNAPQTWAGSTASVGVAGISGTWVSVFPNTTLNYTGASQNYTVPAGVTRLDLDMSGAQGGTTTGGTGGLGERLQARIVVTPGEVLQVNVGGRGISASPFGGGDSGAGFNGGGNGHGTTSGGGGPPVAAAGGGGGGATDIRRGGTALANRVAIAAGGGGASSGFTSGNGGGGGGLTGEDGLAASGLNGTGGTPTVGGTGVGNLGTAGTNGSLGQGGTGGGGGSTGCGGGGGGLYGGGGGGLNSTSGTGGGGGGSGYTDPTAINVVHTRGSRTADGVCIITPM